MKCKLCGSYAINENLHGREKGKDLDLCDVCYWREKYEGEIAMEQFEEKLKSAPGIEDSYIVNPHLCYPDRQEDK
jgi:hypothetical protein